MKSAADDRSSLFNFPVLLTLTAIVCLASYQVFGLNTAIGVATGSTLLSWCALRRSTKTSAAEVN